MTTNTASPFVAWRERARLLLLAALLLNAFVVWSGHAGVITVTSLNDSGPGSLRAAVASASPGDTINFSVNGVITLTSGEIAINKDLTIAGPGAGQLTISGNNASRIFNVAITTGGSFSVSAVTIANGLANGGDGGGILMTGGSSPMNFDQLAVVNNVAGQNGGGFYYNGLGPLTVANCTFSANSAATDGGAIDNAGGGPFRAINSTFSGNSAGGDGGGVMLRGNGPGSFFNVTITLNTADSDDDGNGNGGGLRQFGAPLDLNNTIVAGNFDTPGNAGPGPRHPDISGGVFSGDYNLIQDITGTFFLSGLPPHTITGVTPALGPLANNGGPTLTHLLPAGSPALDAGNDAECPATDQRGQPRADADCDGITRCDIGAYEAPFNVSGANQPPPAVAAVSADCHSGKIIVTFSSAVDAATATAANNYVVSGGAAVTVNLAAYGPNRKTVFLDAAGLAAGVAYTLTVVSVQHLCGTAVAANVQFTPFACPSEIRGRKFKEVVFDCVQSGALEIPLANWIIQLNGGLQTTKTDANGDYFFIVPPGSYTVSELPKPYWTQVCPAGSGTYTVPIGAGQLAPNINFGNKAMSAVQDLSVAIFPTYPPPLQAPCCDQLMTYAITLANRGNAGVVNSSITFWLLAGTTFQSALPPPTTQSPLISPTTFTWAFPAQLNPGATRTVYVTVMVNSCNPFALVPPTLTAKATVTSDGPGSTTPADNTTTHNVQVSCSYDPNDKQVSPLGCGFDGLVPLGTTFTYLVQFQNTGSGSAQQVVVRDTLDNALDLATVETIGASHTCLFAVNGRELIWTFPAIQLAAASLDEPASHGWVKYRVRPRANSPAGTFIQNSARIYFDLNPPVFTATTFNTLTGDPLPVTSFNMNSVPGQENTFDFTYTGGTAGANLLWEFGPDAMPPTSEETNPSGVVFTGTGLKRALLRVMLDDCVSEPAVQVFRIGRPVLNVRREGQRVVLSWLGAGFTLQETSQLDTSATWNNSTLEVTNQMAGDELSNEAAFTVPDGIGKKFFRLSDVQ